jgi:hypothetical protein
MLRIILPHYDKRPPFVQSIIGATERRRDGGTMAVAAGMVEGVLMREGVVAWKQAMNTVENAPS